MSNERLDVANRGVVNIGSAKPQRSTVSNKSASNVQRYADTHTKVNGKWYTNEDAAQIINGTAKPVSGRTSNSGRASQWGMNAGTGSSNADTVDIQHEGKPTGVQLPEIGADAYQAADNGVQWINDISNLGIGQDTWRVIQGEVEREKQRNEMQDTKGYRIDTDHPNAPVNYTGDTWELTKPSEQSQDVTDQHLESLANAPMLALDYRNKVNQNIDAFRNGDYISTPISGDPLPITWAYSDFQNLMNSKYEIKDYGDDGYSFEKAFNNYYGNDPDSQWSNWTVDAYNWMENVESDDMLDFIKSDANLESDYAYAYPEIAVFEEQELSPYEAAVTGQTTRMVNTGEVDPEKFQAWFDQNETEERQAYQYIDKAHMTKNEQVNSQADQNYAAILSEALSDDNFASQLISNGIIKPEDLEVAKLNVLSNGDPDNYIDEWMLYSNLDGISGSEYNRDRDEWARNIRDYGSYLYDLNALENMGGDNGNYHMNNLYYDDEAERINHLMSTLGGGNSPYEVTYGDIGTYLDNVNTTDADMMRTIGAIGAGNAGVARTAKHEAFDPTMYAKTDLGNLADLYFSGDIDESSYGALLNNINATVGDNARSVLNYPRRLHVLNRSGYSSGGE